MKAETYVIKYNLIFPDRTQEREIKVKNCFTELQAKMKLSKYVTAYYPKALRMEITSIKIENFFSKIFPGFKGF